MTTRREQVPFDPFYFERLAKQGTRYSPRQTFEYIYQAGHWSGSESASGAGSGRDQTAHLRDALPALMRDLRIRALLDLPCGDFGWMRMLQLPVDTYIGADLVPSLIDRLQERYADARRRFMVLDVTTDSLPDADLLLCRDCLVHLSFDDIFRALANIRRSGIPYLLATTFPDCERNEDVVTGDWRVLNLELPPFNFPPPQRLLNEHCTEGDGAFRDKSLGLWSAEEVSS